jgi:thiol-disulfide isomerase/thioredoxin
MSRRARSRNLPKRSSPAEERSSKTPLIVALVVVGGIVLAALAALLLTSGDAAIPEPASAPVAITGSSLPPLAESGPDPAVGMRLPTIQGVGLDGEPLTIGPDGRAKAIVVLAHWCSHCQAELPRLQAWLAQHDLPANVEVVAVSTSIDPARPNYPPSDWLERAGWTHPVLTDDANSTALRGLGLNAFPGWVFVAADGAVQLRLTGELDPDQFGAIIDELAGR